MGRLSRERTNRTQSRDGKPIPYFFIYLDTPKVYLH